VRETQRPDVGGCNYNDGRRWTLDPRKNWHNPGFPQTGTDPVVCVSWDDAQAYVAWLNTKVTGASGRYRIPSEAEWEYAARHGAETPFYWGPAASHDLANYGAEDCFPCGVAQAGRDRWDYTSPAGAFPPNGFGLYDMAGNVWQWTADCWNETFTNAPRDGSAWTTGECRIRILRGGSWLDPSMFLSIPTRNRWPPDDHNNANGFRVARSLR